MAHTEEWKSRWIKPEIEHGKLTKYNYLVHYPEGLQLGKYIDISQFVYIQARYGVIIEDDVEIGPGARILSESTIDDKTGLVKICKGAAVGANSVVMPGVTIGENSIVGALSLVNKNIPPNVIAFGTPCQVIKER